MSPFRSSCTLGRLYAAAVSGFLLSASACFAGSVYILKPLPFLALGMNNHGDVVGHRYDAGRNSDEGFLYAHGRASVVSPFPQGELPRAINDRGQIALFIDSSHS